MSTVSAFQDQYMQNQEMNVSKIVSFLIKQAHAVEVSLFMLIKTL